jgi:putative ABC transport system permease protein
MILLDGWLWDVRLAARRLAHRPGFTLPAAAILALALGANASIFSLVEAVLLRPLPYRDPGRLVVLWEDHSRREGSARTMMAPATFEDFRRQSRLLRPLAAVLSHQFDLVDLAGTGEAEVVYGSEVDASFFPLLGTAPRLGRTLGEADLNGGAAAVPAAVLSHELWRRRFGGDARVLGRTVHLDGKDFTVAGVMPAGFMVPLHWRTPGQRAELWVPLVPRPKYQNHQFHMYYVLGRLAPGATLARARSEAQAIAGRLAAEFPKECGGMRASVVPLAEQVAGDARASLLLLLGAVTFLLLIACANLAGLLLARSTARQRELAVCTALGAGRGRLAGQVIAEGLLLVLAGGAGGLGLAWAGMRVLPALLPPDLPRAEGVRLDGALLAYVFAASIATGLLAAAIPAWRAAGARLSRALAASGRGASQGSGGTRLGGALVVAQIAVSLLLLAGAALMLTSFSRLRDVDPGFRADHALTFEVAAPGRHPSEAQQERFFRELTRRLAALPGVVAAGGITRLPLEPAYGISELVVEGRPIPAQGPPIVGGRGVTPDYFRAMSIPLLAGRPFSERDDARAPGVALVNRALARRFFAGEPVVGRRLGRGEPRLRIVGVVGDTSFDSLAGEPQPELFLPTAQGGPGGLAMVVRTASDPLALAAAVRREVRAIDRNLPVNRMRTLEDQVRRSLTRPRFSLLVVLVLAGVALALAAAGVGGLMAYTVAQRTREIGIRMALGAERRDAVRMVLGQAARLALAGVGLGLGGGFALMRWLAGQLYQARAAEPLPYLAGAACLLAAALLAGWLPARRASRVDPMIALRHE